MSILSDVAELDLPKARLAPICSLTVYLHTGIQAQPYHTTSPPKCHHQGRVRAPIHLDLHEMKVLEFGADLLEDATRNNHVVTATDLEALEDSNGRRGAEKILMSAMVERKDSSVVTESDRRRRGDERRPLAVVSTWKINLE